MSTASLYAFDFFKLLQQGRSGFDDETADAQSIEVAAYTQKETARKGKNIINHLTGASTTERPGEFLTNETSRSFHPLAITNKRLSHLSSCITPNDYDPPTVLMNQILWMPSLVSSCKSATDWGSKTGSPADAKRSLPSRTKRLHCARHLNIPPRICKVDPQTQAEGYKSLQKEDVKYTSH